MKRATVLIAAFAAACGTEEPTQLPSAATDAGPRVTDAGTVGTPDTGVLPVDPADAFYDLDRLLDVRIQIAQRDWDELRRQTRDFFEILGNEDCLSQPFESPFTYFPATVTVDGETVAQVGLRKKGFLGSLSELRPSLKIKFTEYLPEQLFHGLRRMTLNNNQQDPTRLRQCLGYKLFREAGIPAPRCNFARVTVNGEYMGVYAHVESIKKPFLRRTFGNDDGNLYEGTVSDFRPEWIGTFDKKTNEMDTDRSDLEAIMTALDKPDGEVIGALESLIDLDAFIAFWAGEVLIGHWDGYAGNTNNYYMYRDSDSGKWQFIPWGIDGTFGPNVDNRMQRGLPDSVMAQGALTRRLYRLPSTQVRYVEQMRLLVEGLWDESEILDEIERREDLIKAHVRGDHVPMFNDSLTQMRFFVAQRARQITEELDNPPPWDFPLRDTLCFKDIGTLSATFDTTWGTHPAPNPWATGRGTFTATISGMNYTTPTVGASSGWGQNPDEQGMGVVLVPASFGNDVIAVAYLVIRPDALQTGTVATIDRTSIRGVLFVQDQPMGGFNPVGFFKEGTVRIDEGSTQPGAPLRGSMDVVMFR